MPKWIGSFLVLFNISVTAYAQQRLTGRIYKINSREIISEVNIRNLKSERFTRSDSEGNYGIEAVAGDRLIFSTAGYLTDTITLIYSDLNTAHNIYLRPNIVALEDVDVNQMNKYVEDSIKRRNDYADLLDKKHPVKFMNEKRPGDAPGFNFSPIGFFSKTEKQKRRLKKRIREEDEDEYIDVKFSTSRVALLTRLNGDSLRIFMLIYRPDYKFCRNASNKDMFLYINDKFILFKSSKHK